MKVNGPYAFVLNVDFGAHMFESLAETKGRLIKMMSAVKSHWYEPHVPWPEPEPGTEIRKQASTCGYAPFHESFLHPLTPHLFIQI